MISGVVGYELDYSVRKESERLRILWKSCISWVLYVVDQNNTEDGARGKHGQTLGPW